MKCVSGLSLRVCPFGWQSKFLIYGLAYSNHHRHFKKHQGSSNYKISGQILVGLKFDGLIDLVFVQLSIKVPLPPKRENKGNSYEECLVRSFAKPLVFHPDSSFGQIFNASSYTTEAIFSFIIVVFGLLLFGDLLAKMQSILQCTEVKEDRQRARQRIVEEWVKYHQLPPPLKKKVKQAIQSEWSATRGVNYEAMLDSLPQNIRSDIRRNLYQEIIGTMPIFAEMDDVLISAISGYLHTFSSNEGTYVAIENEPVCQMLFIFGGQLEVSGANNGGQCIILGPGDLCGKELLELCSHPTTTSNLIPATQTIKCVTDVDAFSLRVDDVKLLAIQFHRDGKFRRAFQRYIA